MLAIFHRDIGNPPEELISLSFSNRLRSRRKSGMEPHQIIREFQHFYYSSFFSTGFSCGTFLASTSPRHCWPPVYQRLFCCIDNIFCIFVGKLNNLNSLIEHYGLSGKYSDEAVVAIEAYQSIQNRGLYAADEVLNGLIGSFAFIIYDNKTRNVFAVRSKDGRVPLYWGMAAEGSLVISNEHEMVKCGCGESYAPFPSGYMFRSRLWGLQRFTADE